jgi:hypothetical protein
VQTNNKQNTRDYSAPAVVGSADDGCDFWHRIYSNPELALSEIFDTVTAAQRVCFGLECIVQKVFAQHACRCGFYANAKSFARDF